nr:immunoglobulin heavy chain junction region [Macaca mulatta]
CVRDAFGGGFDYW